MINSTDTQTFILLALAHYGQHSLDNFILIHTTILQQVVAYCRDQYVLVTMCYNIHGYTSIIQSLTGGQYTAGH